MKQKYRSDVGKPTKKSKAIHNLEEILGDNFSDDLKTGLKELTLDNLDELSRISKSAIEDAEEARVREQGTENV